LLLNCFRSAIDELKLQLTNQKQVVDAEREKSIGQVTVQLQKQESFTKDKMVQ